MSYIINKTNGEILLTLLDGTLDTSTGLNLVGKNYISYGELQQENFVKILENFANSTPPASPLIGQIWYDATNRLLNFFDGSKFRLVSTKYISDVAPTTTSTMNVGDTWWDTTNDQYKAFNGSSWVTIGPGYSKVDGVSGAVVENIYDTVGTKHTVVSIFTNNNRSMIMSYDQEFQPNVAVSGFGNIKPGINPNLNVYHNFYHGTARNSETLANIDAGYYLRSNISNSIDGNLTLSSNLYVGTSNITVTSGTTKNSVINNQYGKNFTITSNIAGSKIDSITVDGTTGKVTVSADPTTNLGVATKQYVDVADTQLANNLVANVTVLNNSLLANVTVLLAGIAATNSNVAQTNSNVAAVVYSDSLKAPIASPAFTGNPTAPTPAVNDNDTSIATTAYVMAQDAIRKVYVDANDLILDGKIALRANIASPAFTGNPTAPTPAVNDNDTSIATTEFVTRAVNNMANSLRAELRQYDLYFSLDTRGLDVYGAGAGSVVELLTTLAPVSGLRDGLKAHISSTVQSVTTAASMSYGRVISAAFLTGVSVNTTVNNPSRNNSLVYQITGGVWRYVSG